MTEHNSWDGLDNRLRNAMVRSGMRSPLVFKEAIQVYGLTAGGNGRFWFSNIKEGPYLRNVGAKGWAVVLGVLDRDGFDWRRYCRGGPASRAVVQERMDDTWRIVQELDRFIGILQEYRAEIIAARKSQANDGHC